MKSLKREKKTILLFLITFTLTLICLYLFIPSAKPMMTVGESRVEKIENIKFIAIGDSLTEGVGDLSENGGFVPHLKKDLLENSVIETIDTENYGKKGDTVRQINTKIQKDQKLQESLAQADFITVTAGGNDLIGAITKEFTKGLSVDAFKNYKESYQTDLTKLYETIRTYNQSAPIYQMGIYNPVQVSFKNISEFEEIVSDWDEMTKLFVAGQENVYFVPINEVMSDGLDIQGQESVVADETMATNNQTTDDEEKTLNNLISDTDNFHPNHLGYQLIANEFNDKILETNKAWRKTSNE